MRVKKQILSLLLCGVLIAGNVLAVNVAEDGNADITVIEDKQSSVGRSQMAELSVQDEEPDVREPEENIVETSKGEFAESQTENVMREAESQI